MIWRPTKALMAIALTVGFVACARARPAPSSSPRASTSVAASAAPPTSAAPAPSASASAAPEVIPTGTARYRCDRKGYTAPPGVAPTMTVVGQGTLLNVTFENHGTEPICLFTHVATNGEHFDWITVSLAGGPGPSRTLTFVDDRDRSAPISFELGPGARLTKTIDLDAWAKRRLNGGRALTPGGWVVTVTYDSTHETTVWKGMMHATTTVVVPVSTGTMLTTP